MTDNEKRAHDLTMLYMKEQMKRNQYPILTPDHFDNSTNADYVSGYTDIYLLILNRLEQSLM